MILRTLAVFALILVVAAIALAAMVLASMALEAVLNFADTLETWQRIAIAAAILAIGLVVAMEAHERQA